MSCCLMENPAKVILISFKPLVFEKSWLVVDGCRWFFGWLWMAVDGCGWLWMVVGGCGWL